MMAFNARSEPYWPHIDPSRKPGTGRIGRSLACAAFSLIIAATLAVFVFWNMVLPFYGLLYLWGG